MEKTKTTPEKMEEMKMMPAFLMVEKQFVVVGEMQVFWTRELAW
jgi:hypothetical protein